MEKISVENYAALLEEATSFHGHVCGGIESGTRMTISGLQRIGILDPKGADKKKLIVYVEIDRCATDAIMALTGCRPGKRTMKIIDNGIMAATFVNLETGKAARLVSKMRKDSDGKGPMPNFATAGDDELFSIMDVKVPMKAEDLPGRPVRSTQCALCGEKIMDGREIEHQGKELCKTCFTQSTYYVPLA